MASSGQFTAGLLSLRKLLGNTPKYVRSTQASNGPTAGGSNDKRNILFRVGIADLAGAKYAAKIQDGFGGCLCGSPNHCISKDMTNAFSPAFKSAIDWSKDQKDRRISEQNSAKRAKRLASDDPVERAKAAGTMGPLSGVTENHRLKKNSKLG
jgi:cation transport regulator ChaB